MLSSPVISSDAQNAFVAETFPQIRAQDMAAFFEAATRRLEPATHETFMVANDNQNELVATLRACKAMLGTFSMHLREAVRSGMLRQTDVLLRIDESI